MKISVKATAAFVFILATHGCSRPSAVEEVEQYQNFGMVNLRPLEVQRQESLQSIRSRNFPTDEQVIRTLRDVSIPTQEKLLTGLQQQNPKTPDVQKLHRANLTTETHFLEFLRTRLKAKQLQDPALLAQARAMEVQLVTDRQNVLSIQKELGQKYGAPPEAK